MTREAAALIMAAASAVVLGLVWITGMCLVSARRGASCLGPVSDAQAPREHADDPAVTVAAVRLPPWPPYVVTTDDATIEPAGRPHIPDED